jgi:PKD repeat protein
MKKSFFAILALITLLSACNKQPEACFTTTLSGYTATFTNCALDGTEYEWDFGDGGRSTEANPTHVFAGKGNYQVTQQVSHAKGRPSKITETVEITESLNARFQGSYTMQDGFCFGGQAYPVTITPATDSDRKATITGIQQGNAPIIIDIANDARSFTIARQAWNANRDIICNNATTNADGSVIDMGYTIVVTGTNAGDYCDAVLTR